MRRRELGWKATVACCMVPFAFVGGCAWICHAYGADALGWVLAPILLPLLLVRLFAPLLGFIFWVGRAAARTEQPSRAVASSRPWPDPEAASHTAACPTGQLRSSRRSSC